MSAARTAVDVNDLVGKPWVLGARGPEAFDCWGLVREVMRRLWPDDALPDWASDDMTRERQRALMAASFPLHCAPVPDLAAHGVLLYSERAGHIGIVVGSVVISARRGAGVVTQRTWDYARHFPDLRGYAWHA